MVHLDPWWNPAVEDQATDRAYRIGQTRTVQVHKLMCAGTVEEKIDRLLEQKRKLADQVVSGGEQWITEAELDAQPELVRTLSVQPPRGAGRIRLVRIGPEEAPVDLQPCGGTHVRSTAEISRVAVTKLESKGRQNRRVYVTLVEG